MALLFLIIDDEESAASRRRLEFARFGIRSYIVPSLVQAEEALASWSFDAVVLRAPSLVPQCFATLKWLRSRGESPVLLLVDRDDAAHQIEALEAGATDVMSSQAPADLVAVKLLRLLEVRSRLSHPQARPQTVGSLALDQRTGFASVDGMTLELTPDQFQLVSLLAAKSGEVVSREEVRDILMRTSDIRVVDVQVSRIRKKLKGMNVNDIVLRTIRGRGYSLMARPVQPGSRA